MSECNVHGKVAFFPCERCFGVIDGDLTPTDKSPREFWIARTPFDTEGLERHIAFTWKTPNCFHVIEKSHADKLQAELDELKAEKKKWRFRDSHDYTEELEKDLMELQSIRERLEKCEGLLRKAHDFMDSTTMGSRASREIDQYFAEIEGE